MGADVRVRGHCWLARGGTAAVSQVAMGLGAGSFKVYMSASDRSLLRVLAVGLMEGGRPVALWTAGDIASPVGGLHRSRRGSRLVGAQGSTDDLARNRAVVVASVESNGYPPD